MKNQTIKVNNKKMTFENKAKYILVKFDGVTIAHAYAGKTVMRYIVHMNALDAVKSLKPKIEKLRDNPNWTPEKIKSGACKFPYIGNAADEKTLLEILTRIASVMKDTPKKDVPKKAPAAKKNDKKITPPTMSKEVAEKIAKSKKPELANASK